MKRRGFIQKSSLAALAIGSLATGTPQKETIKPNRLRKGSKVGVVTPASAVSRSAFEKTLENLAQIGFEVVYSDNVRVRRGFLSGTDKQRVQDLHQMFTDSSVEGIICARGGYGSARLLPQLDFDLISQNPKALIGYSDITALHQAIYANTGLVTFHGPVGASTFNDFTRDYFEDVLFKGKKLKIKPDEVEVIVPGIAEGKLIGGNLSLLASLIGTPFQTPFANHILFIEEIGESVYRIDRMLTQIKQSGVLQGISGIVLGYFTDCDISPDESGYENSIGLREVFYDQFKDLNVPVVSGFPFGHEEHNITLPVGISASLDSSKGKLSLLESGVA